MLHIKNVFKFVLPVIFLSTSISVAQAETPQSNLHNLTVPISLIHKIEKQNPTLSKPALLAGLKAYYRLRFQSHDKKQILSIVDFHLPSTKKRLWVFNMQNGDTVYNTYVAQGENTGWNVAEYFSNVFNTDESSIGAYLTGKTYRGVDGRSLRLYGLDKGFNNNAYDRGIVMHPVDDASKAFIEKYGHLGRTLGCFGLNKKIAENIITLLQNDTVLVAYYPNQQWLWTSQYERPL